MSSPWPLRLFSSSSLCLCFWVLFCNNNDFHTNRAVEVQALSFSTTMTSRLSSRLSSLSSTTTTSSSSTDRQNVDIVICGGGPCGLLSGIMLSQKYPNYIIKLYDDRPQVPNRPNDDMYWSTDLDKRYLIGLGGRGITSLQQFGVWDTVVAPNAIEVPRRIDWNTAQGPDPIVTVRNDKKYKTQVLPRDKLVSCLYQHIIDTQQQQEQEQNNENGLYSNLELCYGWKVEPVKILVDEQNDDDDDDIRVWVDVVDTNTSTAINHNNENDDDNNNYRERQELATRYVIAADGSSRTFATEIERLDPDGTFKVVKYEDDNQRVYKNIPFRIPLSSDNDGTKTSASVVSTAFSSGVSWNVNTNYAVRTDRVIFDALPANNKGDFVGVLLLRANDDMAQPNVDLKVFRAFLQEQIPQFVDLFDETTIQRVAERPPSFLPRFRYITPRMHQNYRTVLMGDCAKTVKPYFGMGANSALEDVKLLAHCIVDHDDDLSKAIGDFSDRRSPDIETLVRISHDLDRPGLAGTFSFLIPIILDGIFSKVAPDVFAPNVISLLQDEELTFQDAARRKRSDRVGQIIVLSTVLVLVWEGFQSVGTFLS
jgi:kynurenine 3-monooxygenase